MARAHTPRSGQTGPDHRRIDQEVGIRTCLSAGLVDLEKASLFKRAGLDRLNHNLNTSRRHTGRIVGTHTYQDRIRHPGSGHSSGTGKLQRHDHRNGRDGRGHPGRGLRAPLAGSPFHPGQLPHPHRGKPGVRLRPTVPASLPPDPLRLPGSSTRGRRSGSPPGGKATSANCRSFPSILRTPSLWTVTWPHAATPSSPCTA